ncbi:MAG: hypothetical protein QW667_07460 [Candidatus Bathyarchaeia archaeon]
MQPKPIKEHGAFTIRVKMGDYEVEVCGTREEVLKTIQELPVLTPSISKAFENLKQRTAATITLRKESAKQETIVMQRFPKIGRTDKCDEAVLKVLESEWGKWRPRTMAELKEAMKANELNFPANTLAGVLAGLVKKGTVRRWKTDAGYVYILAEKEALT